MRLWGITNLNDRSDGNNGVYLLADVWINENKIGGIINIFILLQISELFIGLLPTIAQFLTLRTPVNCPSLVQFKLLILLDVYLHSCNDESSVNDKLAE